MFGLLFTELNSAQAKIIADRIRKNVELLTGFSNRYDVPEQMTIKGIGTVFSTGDTRNISLIMTEADKALREAKSEGQQRLFIIFKCKIFRAMLLRGFCIQFITITPKFPSGAEMSN